MNKMRFHFLNVGHGDCTFVELPSLPNESTGRLMMVDINNSKSLPTDDKQALAAARGLTLNEFARPGSYSYYANKSWEDYYKELLIDPYDYYTANFSGRSIFRYVQTHPDMDHMSGLHNFFWANKVPLINFWDVDHAKSKTESDFPEGGKHSYLDWLVYTVLRMGISPKGFNPDDTAKSVKDVTVLNKHRHHTGSYWSDDSIQILSPTPELVRLSNESEKWNDVSYVMRFEFGGRSVILAGDAEQNAWQSMVDDIDASLLDCDVLKAAHHGRKSGYHDEAVGRMNPSAVICSVGKKPTTDAHQEYKNQGAEVFSTRSKGTMVATLWEDGEVWIDGPSGNNRLITLPPLV